MNKFFMPHIVGVGMAPTLILIIATSQPLFPQASDGNIVGAVSDQTGASVAGATITLSNNQTGVKRTANTDNAGSYRFSNVPVGPYDLSATASGFATQNLKNVAVELNRTVTANLRLSVSSVST